MKEQANLCKDMTEVGLPTSTAPKNERRYGLMGIRTLYDQIDAANFEVNMGVVVDSLGVVAAAAGEYARRRLDEGVLKRAVVVGAWGLGGILLATGEWVRRGAKKDREAFIDEAFIRLDEASRNKDVRSIVD
jgi:hypothetical protein